MQESASYLSLAGLKADAQQAEETSYPADQAIALYDAFEQVAEQLIGNASSLMISLKRGAITLAADAARAPEVKNLPVPARVREEEGILYVDRFSPKGGEQA